MKKMTVLVAVLVLAGCGGGGSDEGGVTTTEARTATTAEVTTTTEDSEAAIRQYASLLNPQLSGIPEDYAKLQECVTLYPDPSCDLLLPVNILTAGIVADTILVKLGGAEKRIGPAPAEIEGLLQRTTDLAQEVKAGAEAHEACNLGGGECHKEVGGVMAPMGGLNSLVAEWGPYGVG